jgi:enolase
MSGALAITTVRAREILDSRGSPTVEVEVRLAGGARGRAAVPSGASTGSREAVERRDGDVTRYRGRGVQQAIAAVATAIAPAIRGMPADDQPAVDAALRELDGTPNKARLGANAILGVSLAVAKAAITALGTPLYRAFNATDPARLPVPMLNVLNGGRHAAGGLDFQELMIVPVGAETFAEALRAGVETYWALGEILAEQGFSTAVGDEGGFAAALPSVEAALGAIVSAIERAGYRPFDDVALALDPAASEFARDEAYVLARAGGARLSAAEMVEWYRRLVAAYPIVSIEDGLGEADWAGWRQLTRALGGAVLVVGDDLFVTNPELIRRGVAEHVANAVLVKLNQVGTVTETLEAIQIARRAGYRIVVSHRSGETEDTTIADFAVAVGAEFIKTGAPCRGERIAKYNRLLRIEEALGPEAGYRGRTALLAAGG